MKRFLNIFLIGIKYIIFLQVTIFVLTLLNPKQSCAQQYTPDQVNDVVTDISRGCGSPAGGNLFQSFRPTAKKLTAVELRLRTGGSFENILSYETSILIRAGFTDGPIIGTASASVPSPQIAGTQLDVTFEFIAPVEVVPELTYLIEWIMPEGGDAVLTWMAAQDDTYSRGGAYGCLATLIEPAEDFIFKTYTFSSVTDQTNVMSDPPNLVSRGCAGSGMSLYQSFTPAASPLAAVDLMLTRGYALPSTGLYTTIKILAGAANGEVLGESTSFIFPEGFPPQDTHFEFSAPIYLIPGQTYLIEWVTPPNQNYAWWVANKEDTYLGGTAYGCFGTPIEPPEDFIFKTYTLINTPEGDDVVVQPIDARNVGESPVTITFEEITEAGTTSLSTSGEGEPLLTGFMLGDPPTYYEMNTTATYAGQIGVCIDYSGVAYINEENLMLYHYEDGAWSEAQFQSQDTDNNIICGVVDSLSPFAIFEPFLGVDIDIRPFGRYNRIIPWSNGLISVAILSTKDFDGPVEVDRSTLTFGRTGYEPSKAFVLSRGKDVNGDGLRDIVGFFRTDFADFKCGDSEGIICGVTKDGMPFKGRDLVNVFCKKRKKKFNN